MTTALEELKDKGLTLRESDAPDRSPVDFTIEDDGDSVATVWGGKPTDVDFECNHPYQCIEFGDDIEEQGECLLCGSWCDYHFEDDEGHKVPEPHEWYPRRNPGGIIGKLLEEMKGERNGF